MFPFDVILFDVGGVLLTNGWDHRERAAAIAHFGLDLPAFEARHTTQNDAWERDLIPVDRYLDETIFYEPRAFTQDEFIACMLSQSKLIPESALGILAELAASNLCLLGALNNEARVTNDYRFETFGLRDRFQIALSSCYVGLRKPHTAIYRRALDIVGAPPQRILFIDDRQENVDAAAAVGMKTIRFQGADALRAELVRMEVLS